MCWRSVFAVCREAVGLGTLGGDQRRAASTRGRGWALVTLVFTWAILWACRLLLRPTFQAQRCQRRKFFSLAYTLKRLAHRASISVDGWNMLPSELYVAWLRVLGLAPSPPLIVPRADASTEQHSALAPSGHTVGGLRVLAYILATFAAISAVAELTPDPHPPWAPHAGLMLTLRVKPNALVRRVAALRQAHPRRPV